MNASTFDGEPRRAPVAAPHPTHKLKLLLKREFWEHKGGFFWAPIIAGGISVVLSLMALIVAEVGARKALAAGKFHGDSGIKINGLDFSGVAEKMSAHDLEQWSHAVNASLLVSSLWPFMVLGFVVFFYCLGALYDERKDRSVLFWKSLPVSDRDTVLSKAASALLVAPIIATVAALATMIAFGLVVSLVMPMHGLNPFTHYWAAGNPLKVMGTLIATIPVYALWALPTVGWLMLCSAWARSKPFLWAVMIPVFTGIFVAWFDVMNVFNLDTGWFWAHIVGRSLLSVFPGTWMPATNGITVNGPEDFDMLTSVQQMYSVFGSLDLWIGAAVGVAMIIAAIRLRRWRDDN
jgi:ABC-2 type transport system permease protein